MVNSVMLVGKLANDIELKEKQTKTNITIKVDRNYKNAEGGYDTDLIDIELVGGLAKNTAEYCKKGDIIGVRGRVETRIKGGKNKIIIVAEKLTFLSSNKR